jgi:hypothetical protein
MKRVLSVLAVFLGLAALAAPASANMVTYTLNCDSVACGSPTNYGTVTLQDFGTGSTAYVQVTVDLKTAGNTFAGTGAGYAINWNIAGTPDSTPDLSVNITTPNPNNDTNCKKNCPQPLFELQDGGAGGHTYSASPFGSNWEYAIDYLPTGGNATHDNKLVFDVTTSTGLTLANFAPISTGFLFAVDIWQGPHGPTFVVAAKVPEPQTWLLFLAGMAGLTALVMLGRRKLARA